MTDTVVGTFAVTVTVPVPVAATVSAMDTDAVGGTVVVTMPAQGW